MSKKKLNHLGLNKKGIFSASFEESRKVTKKGNSPIQDISFFQYIVLVSFFICFSAFGLFSYFFIINCIFLDKHIYGNIGILFKGIGILYIIFLAICFIIFLNFHIFFKNKKYMYSIFQFIFIISTLFLLINSLSILVISLLYKFSSILGIISIFIYALFFIDIIIKQIANYKKVMYQDKINYTTLVNKIVKWINLLIKKYGIWCIGILFLLKSIFRHQNFGSILNKGIVYIIGVIGSILGTKIMIEVFFDHFIHFYYINKYPEEYRQLYKYSKEEWYGKRYRKLGE